MEMALYFEIACGVLVLILFIYYRLKLTYTFWEVRGVPGPKPLPIVGNMLPAILAKMSLGHFISQLYHDFKNAPLIGMYHGTNPFLIVRDPELIRNVLIKDFSKFADRGVPIAEKAEPLTESLFALEPQRWRPLRTKLTPVFTSGKLKDMFLKILDCSENFEKYVEKLATRDKFVDIHDLTSKFTIDVIGICAFGVDTKSLVDEDSEFRRMGKFLFRPTLERLVRFQLRLFLPRFYNFLGYILPQEETTKFFMNLTLDTIKYRKEHKIVRNDFIDTLLELRESPDKSEIEFTDSLTASQTLIFFVAGFQTSSTTMSNALYELALNQDIQNDLRQEIFETYEKNNGDLRYETIKEMRLLDRVFRETLRKYPPLSVLFRRTMSDYTFEGINLSIPKNTSVWIPIYGIQRDPKIYPDPDRFDPDRFTDEAINSRHRMHYLPFGDGPRNCIGSRFAIYQTKIGLIKILRKYRVEVCEKTPIPYVNDPTQFLLTPQGGMYLKITKITSA